MTRTRFQCNKGFSNRQAEEDGLCLRFSSKRWGTVFKRGLQPSVAPSPLSVRVFAPAQHGKRSCAKSESESQMLPDVERKELKKKNGRRLVQ